MRGKKATGRDPFGKVRLCQTKGTSNGDGKADLVIGPGSGIPSKILVLDGTNLEQLLNFNAYDPAFLGGVYVG